MRHECPLSRPDSLVRAFSSISELTCSLIVHQRLKLTLLAPVSTIVSRSLGEQSTETTHSSPASSSTSPSMAQPPLRMPKWTRRKRSVAGVTVVSYLASSIASANMCPNAASSTMRFLSSSDRSASRRMARLTCKSTAWPF